MNAEKKIKTTDFTTGSIPRQLFRFATPLFLANLLQMVYNMVDMVVMGHFVGRAGLSGVSVGGSLLTFLMFFVSGFSNGGQVIISQYLGAGRKRDVDALIGTMFSFLTVSGIVISALCILLHDPILRVMSTPQEAWSNAKDYFITCSFGLIFIYGYNMISAVYRGLGNSKRPFTIIAMASVSNLLLDLLFVAVFHMAAFGAALATVIAQAGSFVFAAVDLYRDKDAYGLSLQRDDFRIRADSLIPLLKLGLPIAIKSGAIQFSKLFMNSWVNSYGVAVSATAGIVSKLDNIQHAFVQSTSVAGSSMVGQNIGAEKYERVPKILLISAGVNVVITAVFFALIAIVPNLMFGIFTDDAAVLAVCLQYIPVAAFMYFGNALRAPMNSLVNGSGNYKLNFAFAFLDGFVLRCGLGYLLGVPVGMGYMGFWYGDAWAGIAFILIGLIYLASGKWKTTKFILQKKDRMKKL